MNNCACTRPAVNGFACPTCATGAAASLRNIASIADEFDYKRARVGSNWKPGTIGRAAETPMPYDPRVTDVANPVKIALVGLARIVVDDNDSANPDGLSRDSDIAAIATWLIDYCDWLRMQPYGPDEFRTIAKAEGSLNRLFDQAPARNYIGRCAAKTMDGPCPEPLYVRVGESAVRCRACTTEHEVGNRQEELKVAVSAYLGTATEISALCRHMLGDLVTASMIRGYVHRGQLISHGTRLGVTRDGKPRESALYRIGEVLEVAQKTKGDARETRATRKAGAEVA